LREQPRAGNERPCLTVDDIENLLLTLPRFSPTLKQSKLLTAIELQTPYPGASVHLTPDDDAPLAWATNAEEFAFYADSLIARGLIIMKDNPPRRATAPIFSVQITSAGWDALAAIGASSKRTTQAFVAMSFDSSLVSVYSNAIEPAIRASGYIAYRIDREKHVERIDVKVMAEIRESRFLVADVTQQKAGVYYEAGFAQGLGLPVIWCVREDDLKNIHFDTKQYNHIVWKDEAHLRAELESFVLAVVGRRAP
jgi:hypothetical protein